MKENTLMTILNELSQALATNVETLNPSIVSVHARRRLPATGVVWSADGLIVTANHVVRRDDNIKVGLHGGDTVAVTLIGRDPTTDIAVLKADTSGLTVASWANMDALKIGHLVLALGRPGQSVQATLGVVSALAAGWRTPAGGKLSHYVQTDVVMYPGFSGGPLVDVDGNVIGLNTSGLMRGVSLAVPNTSLRDIVTDLQEHGRVRRGYLGIAMQPVRLPEALQAELNQETGLLIVSVEEGSPASDGGLLLGDTIVGFNGESVRHTDHLMAMLARDSVGQTVEVKIVRGGALQTVNVTVGEHQ
jgi:S1-C subfamily serine protease